MLFIYIIFLTTLRTYTVAQEDLTDAVVGDSSPKLKGPLVTYHKENFADTLMVLLQSFYYNNKAVGLQSRNETATVLDVDLIAHFEGTLTHVEATGRQEFVTVDGDRISVRMTYPTLLVNKTYSLWTARDPDYFSEGYVTLTVEGMEFITSVDSSQVPYFVNSVSLTEDGRVTAAIHTEGVPIAEVIKDTLVDLVEKQFEYYDITGILNDAQKKLKEIFNQNQLILCESCDYSYCHCQD